MAKRRRSRIKWKPLAVAAGLICLLALVPLRCEPEPLSTKEILEKDEWSREELVRTMAQVQVQRKSRGVRREVFEHFRKKLEKYDEPERRKIVEKSVNRAMDESLRQWRAMEPDVREKLVGAMLEEAKKNRETVENLPSERKEGLRKRLESEEGRARLERVRQRMLSRLTAQDRKLLAPVVKQWVETLESL